MKLRIRGNSIRLRLTQSEVKRIADGERVEERAIFGALPEESLIYALETSSEATKLNAAFRDNQITVYLPRQLANEWAMKDEYISVNGEQKIDEANFLQILIEKDFACLTERRAEDADTFPHPMAGKLRC